MVGFLHVWPTPDRHILFGVSSLLLSCLTQVLVFTYLTVTGKVIAQAVHLGRLDMGPLTDLNRRKRTVTRLLGLLLVTVVLLTGTGAVNWRDGTWATIHFASALLALGIHVLVLLREYFLVAENAEALHRTISEYTRRVKGIDQKSVSQVSMFS